jgi:small subunit ribosomal protein S11
VVHSGYAHIHASFNNTMITITDTEGNVIRVVERGRSRLQGFAQRDAVRGDPGGDCRRQRRQDAGAAIGRSARDRARVGRESAIRALQTIGIEVKSIRDVTPIPHNGCRPPKRRRV